MESSKARLKECLIYDRKAYTDYLYPTYKKYIYAVIKKEPLIGIHRYIINSRKADFYKKKWNSYLLYLYFTRKKNRIGNKLGLEIGTQNIGRGLLIYHMNNVINGRSIIGENLHLHGNNCIGNNGVTEECPVVGNNVTLGVGAKIIGNVEVADNIKVAAGAVVINSFTEPGITIGGIPARKLK